MKTLFEQQGEFFKAMGSPALATHTREECCVLSEKLIDEEVVQETLPALRKYQLSGSLEHLAELADGLVDSVYVLLHAANSLGIPFDLCWNEVHRANMSKLWEDGKPRRNEYLKIMKPPTFVPPDIYKVILDHQTEKEYGKDYMRTGMVK